MAESEEELNSLLMKVKDESGKCWPKTQHSENEDHGIRSHRFKANRQGNNDTLFFWAPKSLKMVTAAMKLKDTFPWKKSYDQPREAPEQLAWGLAFPEATRAGP